MFVHNRYRILVLCLVAVFALTRSSPAQKPQRPYGQKPMAQNPMGNKPMGQQPMAMPVTFSGTVQQIRAGLLQVASSNQESYVVKVEPRRTKVQCTGTAEPDFLRTGLYVRFSGEFDNRGTSKGDVSELTIVTLSDTVRPGVMADAPAGGLDDQANKKKGKAKAEGGKYVVVGQIRGVKNEQLTVSAPGVATLLKVTLAPTAKINVDAGDVTLAQQGDEVDVQGHLIQPGQNGQPAQVAASEITIKLAKPLSAPSKKKLTKSPAIQRGKKTDDAPEKSDKGAGAEKKLSGLKTGPSFGKPQ